MTAEASINALANVPYSGDVSAATVRVAGGTVQRTLAARFGEVFNVLDFGVVADCNILDWQYTGNGHQAARFQAAFDACHANGGGVVRIPKPPNGYAYKFCQTLTIYEHTFVEGETGGNTTGSLLRCERNCTFPRRHPGGRRSSAPRKRRHDRGRAVAYR